MKGVVLERVVVVVAEQVLLGLLLEWGDIGEE